MKKKTASDALTFCGGFISDVRAATRLKNAPNPLWSTGRCAAGKRPLEMCCLCKTGANLLGLILNWTCSSGEGREGATGTRSSGARRAFQGELQPGWGRLLIKPRPQKTNFDEMPEVGARDTEASNSREVCTV